MPVDSRQHVVDNNNTPLHLDTSRNRPSREGINKKQIKKIKTLQSKLGMPDDEYRLLLSGYWVNSCKGLSFAEALKFIEDLEVRAVEKGVWKTLRRKKYDDLEKREGMGSPRQLRMIEAMWRDVTFTHDKHKQDLALRRFIFRIAGVDDLVFLTSEGVRKVIKAIQSMRRKHPSYNSPLAKGDKGGCYRDRAAYGGF